MVTDGSAGRLHFGEQSFSGPSPAKTSRSKEDTSRTSRPRNYVRSITIPVVATYEQGHCAVVAPDMVSSKISYFKKRIKTTATAHAAGTGSTIRLRGAY